MKHNESDMHELLERVSSQLSCLQERVDQIMSTQADLTQAVTDLDTAITALEAKVDSLNPAVPIVDQATLDSTVSALQAQKVRIDAETAKK